MSGENQDTGRTTVFRLEMPSSDRSAVVVASPHSGRHYPDDLKKATRLDPIAIRRSEDCFVDSLFADAPEAGAPLLSALLPRAYVDVNREPFEIDPELADGPVPDWCNTISSRVAVGLGTVPRVVGDGQPIYPGRLPLAEMLERVEKYYRPYHRELARILEETKAQFGFALLIDAHSMPSKAVPKRRTLRRESQGTVDIVLGDCFGTSCGEDLTQEVEEFLYGHGLMVARNMPYAGGYTTRHYGRPDLGVHALQIEINRALYMDEASLEPHAGLGRLRPVFAKLIELLAARTAYRSAAE